MLHRRSGLSDEGMAAVWTALQSSRKPMPRAHLCGRGREGILRAARRGKGSRQRSIGQFLAGVRKHSRELAKLLRGTDLDADVGIHELGPATLSGYWAPVNGSGFSELARLMSKAAAKVSRHAERREARRGFDARCAYFVRQLTAFFVEYLGGPAPLNSSHGGDSRGVQRPIIPTLDNVYRIAPIGSTLSSDERRSESVLAWRASCAGEIPAFRHIRRGNMALTRGNPRQGRIQHPRVGAGRRHFSRDLLRASPPESKPASPVRRHAARHHRGAGRLARADGRGVGGVHDPREAEGEGPLLKPRRRRGYACVLPTQGRPDARPSCTRSARSFDLVGATAGPTGK